MSTLSYKEIKALESIYGDSFYLFDDKILKQNITLINKAFKKHYNNFKIGYSVKTNFIPLVCKMACDKGAYAEIVSPMELEFTKRIGVKGSNVIYNGPIKDEESLLYCLSKGSKINIDNNEELRLIIQILSGHPTLVAKLGVRVNLDLEDGSFSRFGYDVNTADFEYFLKTVRANDQIKLIGIHYHATKSDKSISSYLKRLEGLHFIITKYDVFKYLEYIDLGGGYYGPMDSNIKSQFESEIHDYNDYGNALGVKMKEYFPDENIEFIIEPGLAMVVNILDFYTRVTYKKELHSKGVIGVSGSFYDVKPSGHKRNLTMKLISDSQKDKKDEDVIIGGFTCLENDILFDGYSGESIEVDDYLVFQNVGAYTLVFKPPFIKLSPAILSNHGAEVLREKEKFDDIFKSFLYS